MAIGDAEVTRNEHITVEFFVPYQRFHSPIVACVMPWSFMPMPSAVPSSHHKGTAAPAWRGRFGQMPEC